MDILKTFIKDRIDYIGSFCTSNVSLLITGYASTLEMITTAQAILGLITQIFSLMLAVLSFIAILKKGTFEKYTDTIFKKFINKKTNSKDE